ncbi:ethanolamine kinase 1-like [Lineus longissimus]|uniref:ethanolamine kinase 1-like n=1 Tax=Lineus longissimus TaxID=88925 RepID=UPI00315D0335
MVYGFVVGKTFSWGDQSLFKDVKLRRFNSQVPSFEDRKQEISMIIDKMRTASIPWTFCHIDCNPTNIIYLEEEDQVIFVDLEACGLCNPILDIANFLDGAASGFDGDPTARGFTREENKDFMRVYLAERNRLDKGSEKVDETELEKYLDITEMYQIGTCFMVHMMMTTLAMAGMPKEYLEAGVGRLQHYRKNKDRMLSLYS